MAAGKALGEVERLLAAQPDRDAQSLAAPGLSTPAIVLRWTSNRYWSNQPCVTGLMVPVIVAGAFMVLVDRRARLFRARAWRWC